eukprot:1153050-Pelagomonas_calceolata.AAC.10
MLCKGAWGTGAVGHYSKASVGTVLKMQSRMVLEMVAGCRLSTEHGQLSCDGTTRPKMLLMVGGSCWFRTQHACQLAQKR